MDNYHLHEVIGRGKYSTVYKGIKKKSLRKEVAVKRVDKSQKSAVLEEVKVLQILDHSNVLKCDAWHQTSDHLWLILEYCGGGDLRTMLNEESKLPEGLVNKLACDLVSGLRYLHSKGIIHCDLKPSNILLDGNGHTKLGDFGLARKSRDISKTPSSLRGSPSYMAPELFHDGGVHSYASDIWALGCVLYESYAGRPPFIGKEFTQLANSILSDPTPSLPGHPSRPFADLVNSLLIKDPTDRIQWSEICTHAYWITPISSVSLPPQPAFDKMVRLYYHKPCPPNLEKKTPKNRKKKIQADQKDVSSNKKVVVNLQRLSRIAKSNLQRANEKKYPRRLQNTVKEDDTTDVKIKNTDMELDFNENTEDDETQDKAELSAATPTTIDGSEVPATPQTASPQTTVDGDSGGAVDVDLSEVIFHPSELSVLSVIPSKKSPDNDEQFQYPLPFDAIPSSDFVKLPKDRLDDVTKSIVTILNGETTPIGDKQNVVRYLEMLSTNAAAANILTNGSIMPIMVEMLRQSSKESDLRVQLASLVGLLIRHSESINDDLSNSGILDVLNDCVVDKGQEAVRRFSMAALSELLFYISTTQKDQSKATETKTSSSGWQVPDTLISLVTSLLREGEDYTTQLYALRTIENISSQRCDLSTRFTTQDVIKDLCNMFRDPHKQEPIRLAAGSCLVRLVRLTPTFIQQVMEVLTFEETADIAISSKQKTRKEQQICLTLLNMAVVKAGVYFPDMDDRLVPLMEDKTLVPNLISLVSDDGGAEVVRGKCLLVVMVLCDHGLQWLGKFFSNAELLKAVDGLVVKEKEVYLGKCLEVFLRGVVDVIVELLKCVVSDVNKLVGPPPAPAVAASNTNLQLFPVVVNLLKSCRFKHRVVDAQGALEQLGALIKLVKSSFQGRDGFHKSLVLVLGTITADVYFVEQNLMFFVNQVLPIVSIICKDGDSDHKFYFCKIWLDVVFILIDTSMSSHDKEEFKQICQEHFLPLHPQLMEDEDSKDYADKLWMTLVEFEAI